MALFKHKIHPVQLSKLLNDLNSEAFSVLSHYFTEIGVDEPNSEKAGLKLNMFIDGLIFILLQNKGHEQIVEAVIDYRLNNEEYLKIYGMTKMELAKKLLGLNESTKEITPMTPPSVGAPHLMYILLEFVDGDMDKVLKMSEVFPVDASTGFANFTSQLSNRVESMLKMLGKYKISN